MSMIGGGEQVELLSAPELAEVERRCVARQAHQRYLCDQPLAIEPELWIRARDQLRDTLERRGWTLIPDGKCQDPNFILHGVTVVAIAEQPNG